MAINGHFSLKSIHFVWIQHFWSPPLNHLISDINHLIMIMIHLIMHLLDNVYFAYVILTALFIIGCQAHITLVEPERCNNGSHL